MPFREPHGSTYLGDGGMMETNAQERAREEREAMEPVSECCGAPRDTRYVTDFCSQCHEHATFTTEEP